MKKNISVLLANTTGPGLLSCKPNNEAVYIDAGLWPVTYTIASEMKPLKSVAFFIETDKGKFYKFLSTEPVKSRFGFEELRKTGSNYTGVIIKLREDYGGNSKITVVGNYHENNLTALLKSVKSMDEVLAIKENLSESGSNSSLLMFDHKVIEVM